uniref:Protein fam210b-like n=1 Tax=Tetraselmis sp. GSL018 TaxID=582737 RepID=A0A061R5E1_9CHLO|mmetsp:Transcript_29449/g.70131  ORF Transcript_29449/g.70131 Transcript_29449/m.70131 type:complete len:196 (-) Transcript_29449:190-777(-)|eukprot:CAMPEP_0177597552 /NCGR_PEP_ID=MMETSP0419_2-20121207/11773_1 /TAXON_ID=582737 /ORGANISM="Tetraselmis sp., Strain GSL018" /LENGTH=195 /DNA_ID=CAMNT_0019089731 /DNA_START=226 /DNA_END=813 /DNA_ORIENTATION=+
MKNPTTSTVSRACGLCKPRDSRHSYSSSLAFRRKAQAVRRRLCTHEGQGRVSCSATPEEPKTKSVGTETTEKYGLEAGLFKVFTDKSSDSAKKATDAKELLKRYGSAYLITSISFAIVSYAICYVLVDQGVDVAALLGKVGISTSATSEKVGTAAIAYAAHKAASPIRFPPTVALTPVVAKLLGKKVDEGEGDSN